MKPTEQIFLTFYEGEEPKAVMFSNGNQTFYKLKKMNREDITMMLSNAQTP